MDSYGAFKIVHLLGIILLVGNVTVTACWKFYADRTRDPVVIGFSQRLVVVTDWAFTFWGILLTIIGGYGATWVAEIDPFRTGWVLWPEILFAASGGVWLLVLLPIQIRQARQARSFVAGSTIP